MSRGQFYLLRKRKEWENSIESPMCNHPYFAVKISREEFRRRGIRPRALRTDLHSAVVLGGEDGNKAGNKEHLKRLYNICH